MQENNGPGSANKWDPDPVLRTRTEVQAITHYLQTVSEPWTAEAAPAGLSGDPAAGQQLFADVGCLGCHGNIAEYGEAWIVNDLAERRLSEDPDADENEAYEQADTQFGGVGADIHPTERRLTGRIQAMMSDPALRGRVIWLLMTARIHLLSPDIRRPGRVGDLIIPVLDPRVWEGGTAGYPRLRVWQLPLTLDVGWYALSVHLGPGGHCVCSHDPLQKEDQEEKGQRKQGQQH